MNSKLAIFAASFIAIGSISGIALGKYATSANASGEIKEASTDEYSDSFDSSLTSPIGTTAQMLSPDHIPVCRKGCGPTLSERREANYYGDEYSRKLDAIYRDDQEYSSDEAAVIDVPDITPRLAHVTTVSPTITIAPHTVPTIETPHRATDIPSAHDAVGEALTP